jgi:hypothetical protein
MCFGSSEKKNYHCTGKRATITAFVSHSCYKQKMSFLGGAAEQCLITERHYHKNSHQKLYMHGSKVSKNVNIT